MKHGCRPSSSLRIIIFRNISGYIQRRQETGHLAPLCLCRLAIGCQGNGALKGRLCSGKVPWGIFFHLETTLLNMEYPVLFTLSILTITRLFSFIHYTTCSPMCACTVCVWAFSWLSCIFNKYFLKTTQNIWGFALAVHNHFKQGFFLW